MAEEVLASFVWTVKNFDMCPHLQGQRLHSPVFSVGSYIFRLALRPRGGSDPNYIAAYFQRVDNCETVVLVKLKLSPVDEQPHKAYAANYKNNTELELYKFIKRDKLSYVTREVNTFLPTDLTIKCDVLSLSVNEGNTDKKKNLYDCKDVEILSRDFAEILSGGQYSDMVLVVDENRFSVHKAIIECRCPKLLSELRVTGVANEYTLDGIKAPVLQALLQYLYTGVLSIDNMYKEIFVASNAYNIPELTHLLRLRSNKTVRATTEIKVSKLSFTWTIVDFSTLKMNQVLASPDFSATEDEWCEMKFILTVIESGIQIKIIKLNTYKVGFIRCRMSINRLDSTIKKYEIFLNGNDWEIPLISYREFSHLLNDTMTICFEVSMSNHETNLKIEEVSIESKLKVGVAAEEIKNLKLFQKDLLRLFNDGQLSNYPVIAIRAGDTECYAHKFILCARSRLFAKMFENDTLEKTGGVAPIGGIAPETMLSMLRYLHCGCIDSLNFHEANQLLIAARNYELVTLIDKCMGVLKTITDSWNVGNRSSRRK